MLTEREWLEDREYARYHYSCQWCSQYDPMLIMPDRQSVPCMWYSTCPCNTNNYDYKDALEFSERVTTRLAKVISNLVKEEPWPDIEVQATTPDLVLKWVRLSVEEEMDENS